MHSLQMKALLPIIRLGTPRARCGVPVMMFSTSGHQRDVEQAREMGAEAYSVKPLTFEELVHFVKRLYSVWARGEIGGEWPNSGSAT